jgi:arginase
MNHLLKAQRIVPSRAVVAHPNISNSFSSTSTARGAKCSGGGIGIGNVQDKMIASSDLSFQHVQSPKTVSIIGAPMTYGQPFVGVDCGPKYLREKGLLKHLSSLGWRVHDQGDLNFDALANELASSGENLLCNESPNAKNSNIVGKGCEMLAESVVGIIDKGHFPLILGGDHSVGAGSLAGLLRSRPNTGVIWVDAHADINTPSMSESGNMHGMPIGLLMEDIGEDASIIPGFQWLASPEMASVRLDPASIVYVGLRDVDTEERRIIREKNIKAFTMFDIDKHGIGKVMDLALAHLLEKDSKRPIHVSYDIDAVDPIHAPATGTTVRGGLTYREAHYVAEAVASSGSLASVEIVELNPTLSDGAGSSETIELGLGIITSLMGKSIL